MPGDGRHGVKDDDDDEADEDLVVPAKLDNDDFLRLEKYVDAVKPFTTLVKFLSGDSYPTAGLVIPALEQIKDDLENMLVTEEEEGESKKYIENLLNNIKNKRFKDNWKKKTPFNTITFLDPRNVDLYCLDDSVFNKVKNDIKYDSFFNDDSVNFVPQDPPPQPGTSS